MDGEHPTADGGLIDVRGARSERLELVSPGGKPERVGGSPSRPLLGLIREDPDSLSGGQPRYALFLHEAKHTVALA